VVKKYMLFEMFSVADGADGEGTITYLRFVAQFDREPDLWEYAGYHYKGLKEIQNLYMIEASQLFPIKS